MFLTWQASFAELLAQSKLISEGCMYEGRLLEGSIARTSAEFIYVDVGLKFLAVMRRTDVPVPKYVNFMHGPLCKVFAVTRHTNDRET